MATLAATVATVFAAGAVGLSIASFLAVLRQPYGNHNQYRRPRSVNKDSKTLERTMALIRKEDFTGCGMKLMCQLGAMSPYRLNEHQLAVLDLVGTIPPGTDLRSAGGTALGQYQLARAWGQGGADCDGTFPLCPFNRTELMAIVTSHGL